MFKYIFAVCLFSLVGYSSNVPKKDLTTAITNNSAESSREKQLIQSLASLTDSPMTKMNSIKTVESSLIGKKTKYSGEIYLSRGKFRWNTFTPEKSTLVFDGKNLWIVQDQFVTRTILSKDQKSQTLRSILLDPKSLKKKFDLKKKNETPTELSFHLIPKSKDLTVTNIQVTIDATNSDLKTLTYNDNDNQTVIEFDKIEKLKKADAKQFLFKPKPGDQVTEM
jgi:outer membrane lipoprotein-sorting protein